MTIKKSNFIHKNTMFKLKVQNDKIVRHLQLYTSMTPKLTECSILTENSLIYIFDLHIHLAFRLSTVYAYICLLLRTVAMVEILLNLKLGAFGSHMRAPT